jgi:hypothetical protein
MLKSLIKQVLVVSQAYDFTTTVIEVYSLALSIQAIKTIAASIINDCASPQIKYFIRCGVFLKLQL